MNNLKLFYNANLKDYGTFKIGGKAKYLFEVYDTNTLLAVCSYCNAHKISFKIIGLGSNLLFDDNGFDGAIIVNKTNRMLFKNSHLYADSGCNLTNLIMQCFNRNLHNFEHLAGIPSTLGGAIVNNTGAFGVNIGDFVEYVVAYHKSNLLKKIIIKKQDCMFDYRNSIFKNDEYIITRAKLNLSTAPKNLILQTIKNVVTKKSSTQPLDIPSAGSIFKRSTIIPAKIIDQLNLKGLRIGDAEISKKHAGFIVNVGNATSNDVKKLIESITNKVYSHCAVKLEKEIEFVP